MPDTVLNFFGFLFTPVIDSVFSNFCQITIDFIKSDITAGLSVGTKAPNTAAMLPRRGTGFKLELC